METPICDFVTAYRDREALRLHMPGHRGADMLGMEALDITEIDGADVLYSAKGIIRQSEGFIIVQKPLVILMTVTVTMSKLRAAHSGVVEQYIFIEIAIGLRRFCNELVA